MVVERQDFPGCICVKASGRSGEAAGHPEESESCGTYEGMCEQRQRDRAGAKSQAGKAEQQPR